MFDFETLGLHSRALQCVARQLVTLSAHTVSGWQVCNGPPRPRPEEKVARPGS